jgi:hypothetical protein
VLRLSKDHAFTFRSLRPGSFARLLNNFSASFLQDRDHGKLAHVFCFPFFQKIFLSAPIGFPLPGPQSQPRGAYFQARFLSFSKVLGVTILKDHFPYSRTFTGYAPVVILYQDPKPTTGVPIPTPHFSARCLEVIMSRLIFSSSSERQANVPVCAGCHPTPGLQSLTRGAYSHPRLLNFSKVFGTNDCRSVLFLLFRTASKTSCTRRLSSCTRPSKPTTGCLFPPQIF